MTRSRTDPADSPGLLARLAGLDTCACSDAMDKLGLPPGAALGLRALTVARKVTGRVLTVQLGPLAGARSGAATPPRHLATAAIEAASPGDVIVVAASGRLDAAAWGGVLSLAAAERGVGGVIIDGACRDVDSAAGLGLPVYALAATPLTARGRHAEVEWNIPVRVAGVPVRPGDLVVADGSGVVFIPERDVPRVLPLAEEVTAAEDAMSVRIKRGEPVSRVLSADYEQMLAGDEPASEP